MSYESHPEFAAVLIDPALVISIKCSSCGAVETINSVHDAILGDEGSMHSCYSAPHIPPTLELTCAQCDADIIVPLQIVVQRKTEDTRETEI